MGRSGKSPRNPHVSALSDQGRFHSDVVGPTAGEDKALLEFVGRHVGYRQHCSQAVPRDAVGLE